MATAITSLAVRPDAELVSDILLVLAMAAFAALGAELVAGRPGRRGVTEPDLQGRSPG